MKTGSCSLKQKTMRVRALGPGKDDNSLAITRLETQPLAADIAQSVECLSGIHRAVGSIPSINWAWWHMPIIPALVSWKQEDQELKVIFGAI